MKDRHRTCLHAFSFLGLFLFIVSGINEPSMARERDIRAGESSSVKSTIGSSRNLFRDVHADRRSSYSLGDTPVVRFRFVGVNKALLEAPIESNTVTPQSAHPFVLNLFEDTVFNAILNRYEKNASGSVTWTGRLQEVEYGHVALVIREGIMEGSITLPGEVYEIRYAGDGVHAVCEIDQSGFPPDKEAIPVRSLITDEYFEGWSSKPLLRLAEDIVMIDVLVVYTDAARLARGGTTAMNNFIDLAVSATNTTYANSDISQRLNLVHTAEATYTESGNIQTDLSRLRHPSDGHMDVVHTLRDAYCADEVVLIVDNGGGYCGVSYLMSWVTPSFSGSAFALVADECAVGNFSFAHELGHNMGARHDWYADSTDNSPYTYNHGYVDTADRWRTIMAYNSECSAGGFNCTRLSYWSNPEVDYGGVPMGVPEGEYHASDNRMTLNNTALTVANFRQSCSAAVPSADFTATPTSGGVPLEVAFTNPSSGDITSFSWDFGDGETSEETSPVHTYATAGTYTVSLTASGPGGDDAKIVNDFIQVWTLHTADIDAPHWMIDGTELSRVLAYWRAGAYHCEASGLDGYAPDSGDTNCDLHCGDFQLPSWAIDGTEANRVLAYWRAGGYHADETGADGYAPGLESQAVLLPSDQPAPTSNVSARHSASSGFYRSGDTLRVNGEFEYSGDLLSLMCRPDLPSGWEIASVTGDGDPEIGYGDVVWTGSLPPSPVRVSFDILVGEGGGVLQQIQNRVEYQLAGMANPIVLYADPDPITLEPEISEPPVFNTYNINGIYKSADHTMNAFVQTYSSGSAVVIFTPDLTQRYAFLAPDWSDGIRNLEDLAKEGHLLSMDFVTSSQAKAILIDSTGKTFQWDLTKAFQAPDSDAGPDGIYKSANNAMNAYLQTYTTGSSILIFTTNLGHWFVFLEPDWNTGFDDSHDLGGQGHNLYMFNSGDNMYRAVIDYSSGPSSEFFMHRVYDSK